MYILQYIYVYIYIYIYYTIYNKYNKISKIVNRSPHPLYYHPNLCLSLG